MSLETAPRRSTATQLALCLLGLAICLAVASGRLRGLLENTALLIVGTWAVSLPLGTALAVAVTKTSLPGRRFLYRAMIAWLLVPLYVQAAAWQSTLGRGGLLTTPDGGSWFTSWAAAIWVHGMAAVPWVVLLVGAALKNVPRQWEEESLLDTTSLQVLMRVSLRRATAGVLAAALWVAVVCAGEITVTDLFQVRTFAEEIYTAASFGTLNVPFVFPADNSQVVELATRDLAIGITAVVCLVAAALAAIWAWVPLANFSSPGEGWVYQLRSSRWPTAITVWLCAALVIGLPIVGLAGKAGQQVQRSDDTLVRSWSPLQTAALTATSPWQHRREIGWSLAIGVWATVAAMALALLIAWMLRTRRLPPRITALLLAVAFALPAPLWGLWTIALLNHPDDSPWSFLTWCYDHTLLAPNLVQTIRALPLATLVLTVQLASVPQDVLDSAASDGAGWWQRLFLVALPQRKAALLAAACLAMILATGELAATLLVSPPGVSTLAVRIFGLLHYGAEDRVAALCLGLAILLTLLASLAAKLADPRGRAE